ncbi:2-octaprenyl-3-methyl-6-methoxy-1,4-benzoquinol hydroxylase [Candidatus Endobugula sertula]|uniref:3-demethoxyubiquinol 3-hydroxylase n=1 Tax=Candidatus Endobugula sertula TaxID=62101 RepID=A0A1D2QT94_9GAMM|nr:2-octaprenyl-3-methyl-6-methoxy-1,4-benzoquinol hydroxylase [Candidatus Endobugula sertula]
MNTRHYSFFDRLITQGDNALRTLSTGNKAYGVPSPASTVSEGELSAKERRHAASLMRVNHTGEVCAQALYQGQSLTAQLPHVRQEMEQAAKEEVDHLNWCDERLKQLDSHTSVLNPLFYGLSFGMGALAGIIGDQISLGFVAATEEKVCQHLETHIQQLPDDDNKSRAIVKQMLKDEARHQQAAIDAGGSEFPIPVKLGMTLMSKIMTKTTYHI